MKEITLSQREINILVDVLNWSHCSNMPRYKDEDTNQLKEELESRLSWLKNTTIEH